MFHSGNEFPVQNLKDILGLKHFECTTDSHGNHFTLFTTNERKRAAQIMNDLNEFNQDHPEKAVQIDNGLGLDPPIVTFGIHNKYRNHHIYLKIKSAKEAKQAGEDVPYKIWTCAIQKQLDRGEVALRYQTDYNVQQKVMQEDPSAFNLDSANSSENESGENTSETEAAINSQVVHRKQLFVSGKNSSSNAIGPFESSVLELGKSITAAQEQTHCDILETGSNILMKQDSMEQKFLDAISDLKKAIAEKDDGLAYLTKELHETRIKLQNVQLARDQEEQKRAAVTQEYNKNMRNMKKEMQTMENGHRLQIQRLKQSAKFSKILRSFDHNFQSIDNNFQKLGQGMVELQAAMLVYEDSDSASDKDSELGLSQVQEIIQGDGEESESDSEANGGKNGQIDSADGAGDLPMFNTAGTLMSDAFRNVGNDNDQPGEEVRFLMNYIFIFCFHFEHFVYRKNFSGWGKAHTRHLRNSKKICLHFICMPIQAIPAVSWLPDLQSVMMHSEDIWI